SMADLMRLVSRSRAKGLKRRLSLALVLVMLGKWTGVVAPLQVQKIIDGLGHHLPLPAILGFAALYVVLQFLANAAPYLRDAIFTPVSQKALALSAVETLAHSLSLSLEFHQTKQSGALARLIDRGSRSVDSLLRSVVFSLGPTVIELAMAAFVLTSRFHDWRLAAVALATIATYVAFTFGLSDWRIQHRRALNEADSAATGLTVDALMNYETVKTFGAEARTTGQFQGAMDRYAAAAVKANSSLQLLNAIQQVVLRLGMFGVVALAAIEAMHGRMSPGGVAACILILQTVYGPLNVLGMNYREIRQAFIDMEQMIGLLAVPAEIVDRPDAREPPKASAAGARLAFEHVGFQHGARSSGLKDIDFVISPGKTLALVGPSGSGKTTIVRLALRLLDPQSGRVTLDGVDLRELKLAALRRTIALVPQDVALFNDTLMANIRFARPDASEAEVWEAVQAAELGGFVESLPGRLETRVGERGLKLSGGERQRVGLARALLADPRLLVLDEATSALDGRTEAQIQAALRKVRAGRTTLVVAHRLSTVADADEILVVRRGRVVERGRHEALVAAGGEYAALWRRQTRDGDRTGDGDGQRSPRLLQPAGAASYLDADELDDDANTEDGR
ncbi:MAG: ABC transporter ATP-binding protein/permease, partial [Caulobacteraceae bacterium]|nr:ABC transporter ATP-binding protein/permease [Caulobacteraceae bacterium]